MLEQGSEWDSIDGLRSGSRRHWTESKDVVDRAAMSVTEPISGWPNSTYLLAISLTRMARNGSSRIANRWPTGSFVKR